MTFGGASQQPVTSTQTADPWSGAQPHLQNVLGQAASLIGSDTGYQPYSGPTQAPLDPWTQAGLSTASSTAWNDAYAGGPAGTQAAIGLGQQMIGNQGLTPGQLGTAIPGIQGAIGNYYGLYNEAGPRNAPTLGQYGAIYNEASGQQNPYLLEQIAANDRRISNQVNSAMSAQGRYGSGAHTDVLGRSLAEAANPILAQDYANRQQTRLAATQGLGGTVGQMFGQQMGALGGAMGGYGNLSNIYNQGANLAGQWAQNMPGLEAARYAGQDKLMQLGQFQDVRNQNDLAAQIALYNAQQSRPWEQLARYNALASGAGGLGGTKVTATPSTAASPWVRALGGGLAGAGLGSSFGPVGAGVGALGGGLTGLFS